MAWSYTKASSNTGYLDGDIELQWTNTWTVSESTGAASGYVRLKVVVDTTHYMGWPSSYAFYCTDTVSYNGTSITIHSRSVVNASYDYTAYVDVPSSWVGKTVRFNICFAARDVKLDVAGASASEITASNGYFGTAIPITLTNATTGVKHVLTVTCAGRTETLINNTTAKTASWTPSGVTYAPLVNNTATVNATFSCQTYLDGGLIGTKTKTITVTFRAGSIAASTITASNGTFGSAVAVSLTRAVAGVKHKLTTSCATVTSTLINNTTAVSASWTPAVATYAPKITNAASATATLTCETYFAGVLMGTTTKTITLSFASGTLLPTVSSGWATAAPYNTGVVSGFTTYVQSFSKARVTFDTSKITCQYGATIASYSITYAGATDSSSPYETSVLTGASNSIVCKVTDSRGRTASATLTVTALAYSKPALSAISVYRSNSSGTAQEDGTYISVKATETHTSLSGQNTISSFKVYTRPSGGSWNAGSNLTSNTRLTLSGFSPDTSYEVKIELTDSLGNTATVTRAVSSQKWAMKFRSDGNGVAFGKTAEIANALELPSGWRILVGGEDYGFGDRGVITSNPSSADALMGYSAGAYRIAGVADTSIFPARYGVLEVLRAQDYGLCRFTAINNTNAGQVWRRSFNTSDNTWYESSWVQI